MPRGYHDWLVAETQGALRTYTTRTDQSWNDPNGLPNLSLFNPAASGTLTRVLRIQATSRLIATWAPPQTMTLAVWRTSALGAGTPVTPEPHDLIAAAAVCQAEARLAAFPAAVSEPFRWTFLVIARSLYEPMASGDSDVLRAFYEHLADGRRQPLTLRPGQGIVIAQTGGGGDVETMVHVEHTEEPLT